MHTAADSLRRAQGSAAPAHASSAALRCHPHTAAHHPAASGTPDRPVLSASPAPAGGVSQLSLSWGAVYTATT